MKNKDVKNLILIQVLMFIIINIFFIILFLQIFSFNNNIVLIILNSLIILILIISIILVNLFFINNKYKKINKYINDIFINNYKRNIEDENIYNLEEKINEINLSIEKQNCLLVEEKRNIKNILENILSQIKSKLDKIQFMNDEEYKKTMIEFNYLLSTIHNISQIDNANFKYENIKLSSLISQSLQLFKDTLKEENIDIKLNVKNINLLIDIKWTKQAILNILKNICKYTDGKIKIFNNNNSLYNEIIISGNLNNKLSIENMDIYIFLSKKILEKENCILDVVMDKSLNYILKFYK